MEQQQIPEDKWATDRDLIDAMEFIGTCGVKNNSELLKWSKHFIEARKRDKAAIPSETVRQIAKREYDKTHLAKMDDPEGVLAWSVWKRAYDSAAVNLPNAQRAIEEMKKWLEAQISKWEKGYSPTHESYKVALSVASTKFNELFPAPDNSNLNIGEAPYRPLSYMDDPDMEG